MFEGVGLACAIELGKAGYDIAYIRSPTSRRPVTEVDQLESQVRDVLSAVGVRCAVLRARDRRSRSAREVFDCLVKELGEPSVLIAAAGVSAYPPRDLMSFTDDDWLRASQSEVEWTFALIRHCLPMMRRERQGRIVLFSVDETGWNNDLALRDGSPFGENGWPFLLAKRWVASLASVLSQSERRYGVMVNEISLAAVDRVSLSEIVSGKPRPDRPQTTSLDVARTVAFLCSQSGRAVSGSTIRILGEPNVWRYQVDLDNTEGTS
jgi:NAD(P)-dependent dehydrogenase (short-subunit alcohol dehydrogenase family)